MARAQPLGGVKSRAHYWVIKPSPLPSSPPPGSLIDARDGRVPQPMPSPPREAERRCEHGNDAYRPPIVVEDAHR
ncbi:hypothetical protein C8Q77DRAFT_1272745, partial [Trametes polyzona]